MAKKDDKKKWYPALKILVMLTILSFIVSLFFSAFAGDSAKADGNVALIPVKGVIISENYRVFGQEVADSPTIVRFIEEADRNPRIKAIILEINSPGGAPVATEEISRAIRKTNKTTVAWIREMGTSAGYWVASSCDKIVASRMSATGSIGAVISYLDFSGLLQDYNVTYQRLIAGKYKDIGTPFKELRLEERRLLQNYLDQLHDYFISAVAENRNLPEKEVRELATGMFYLGEDAKELGLVDVLGGKEEVISLIRDDLNITVELVEYKQEAGLADLLGSVFSQQSFFIGKGIGNSLAEARNFNRLEVWT
ncbi:signal peptide peptidase SppA [Candidatus Woesearchaeota archaeon]|nr:signal peptide peptidase SppA [Candidatus Woesearchaeota archaeon]